MEFPMTLRYTKEHEWIKVEGNTATIGITEFAQGELGDIVFVEVNQAGASLKKDEVFGTIEAVKTVSDLFLPVSGTILEVNARLQQEPELVNKDPYGEGWIVKLKVADEKELDELMDTAAYEQLVS